ncbi:hypothetical protein B0H15DRAFT_1023412 [Mycena belliarum]|uniref:Uncharacterized protein n=1 Tax=Mycena belliarum TaxID=1033014 RepID=A0AAD6TZZ9_9AGAR|nr:hypothetical protein B0H15DRAFT_1023412 [Mycena belliae]
MSPSLLFCAIQAHENIRGIARRSKRPLPSLNLVPDPPIAPSVNLHEPTTPRPHVPAHAHTSVPPPVSAALIIHIAPWINTTSPPSFRGRLSGRPIAIADSGCSQALVVPRPCPSRSCVLARTRLNEAAPSARDKRASNENSPGAPSQGAQERHEARTQETSWAGVARSPPPPQHAQSLGAAIKHRSNARSRTQLPLQIVALPLISRYSLDAVVRRRRRAAS